MLRGLRRRLDRLWDEYRREKAARRREGALDVFYDAVSAEVTRAGFDPDTVPALRSYAEARNPPPAPDRPFSDPLQWLRDKLLAIVERHRREPLDPEHATLLELFAVCCFLPDKPGVAYLGAEIG
jgi:hypothetical protein